MWGIISTIFSIPGCITLKTNAIANPPDYTEFQTYVSVDVKLSIAVIPPSCVKEFI